MSLLRAAKSMGFANSPLPYLSLLEQKNSSQQDDDLALIALCTGVNYASGGAGILDSTVCHDLASQLSPPQSII